MNEKQRKCKHHNKVYHKGMESSGVARECGYYDGVIPYHTCPDCGLSWDWRDWQEDYK